MEHAARVLNPLTTANMYTAYATVAVKELNKFGFVEFRDNGGIIGNMVDELPSYLAKVRTNGDHFWNNVVGAENMMLILPRRSRMTQQHTRT